MTPQERQLVAELFDRLATLENSPRDTDAERAIAEGLARAPHGTYALVQTVLVQDEALKRAHARIEELEGGPAGEEPRQGGFLDNMRDALFGRDEPRGSVPNVRQGGAGTSGVWGSSAGAGAPPAGAAPYGSAPMGAAPVGTGGSFLGTAAASAAGVIGGAMLLNGIRSMFGHSAGAGSANPGLDSSGFAGSPWSGGAGGGGDLTRQAGIDNIGGGRSGGLDRGEDRAGHFGGEGGSDEEGYGDADDADDDTDYAGDFDGGDDSDTA